MDVPSLVPVEYRGGLAALVSAERVHIVAPWLLVRPAGDPELRFLGFMCLCAGQVLRGAIGDPFSSRMAEEWARRALIHQDCLAAMGPVSDSEAARRLNVPVDQLRVVRRAPLDDVTGTRPARPSLARGLSQSPSVTVRQQDGGDHAAHTS